MAKPPDAGAPKPEEAADHPLSHLAPPSAAAGPAPSDDPTETKAAPASARPAEPARAGASPALAAAAAASRPRWGRALRLREGLSPLGRALLGVLFVFLSVAIWWLLTGTGPAETRTISPVVLPSPLEVIKSLPPLISERSLIQSIAATLTRVFLGFGLAVAVGVPMGILAAAWRPLGAFLAPLVLFGRNIPVAALIPLTMIWFGIDETQKVIFIFTACVPFIFADSAAAVLEIPERYVETAETLGATRWQIIRWVLVPLSLPATYTGLRTLFGLAFGYIMLAELVNAQHGLGNLISISQRRSATADIFMILLVITLLAFAIDRLFAFFERGLFPHRQKS